MFSLETKPLLSNKLDIARVNRAVVLQHVRICLILGVLTFDIRAKVGIVRNFIFKSTLSNSRNQNLFVALYEMPR